MDSPRTIVHADLDAFYASVEQRDRPELKGKAVIVGGLGPRGVVCAASYEARAFGVHSAQPMTVARRRCPQGVFLPIRMEAYRAASRIVRGVFERFTPLVEPLSLDEAFLDVTGSQRLFGDGRMIAREIRRLVLEKTRLTISVGVATSKFVAKVASDLEKPDGLCVVPVGQEAAFLGRLGVARLWGAGRRTQERFAALGIRTIADVQALSQRRLVEILGAAAGRHFHALAHGRDDRPVVPFRDPKSVSHETTFDRDEPSAEVCRSVLLGLSEQVGRRLRRRKLVAATVRLKLRYGDFTTVTRQVGVDPPTNDDSVLHRTARELFDRARDKVRAVRLLGVAAADLRSADEGRQLDLFETGAKGRADRLLAALDAIQDRFGEGVIGHGDARKRGSRELNGGEELT